MRDWPALLVVTGRPEFEPPWRNVPFAAAIGLRPIASPAAEALVKRIAGPDRLADATVRGIAARADGVPLFVEELTRAVLDGGAPDAAPAAGAAALSAMPAGLQASLMARLDRLGRTREVARIAAALGWSRSQAEPHCSPDASTPARAVVLRKLTGGERGKFARSRLMHRGKLGDERRGELLVEKARSGGYALEPSPHLYGMVTASDRLMRLVPAAWCPLANANARRIRLCHGAAALAFRGRILLGRLS